MLGVLERLHLLIENRGALDKDFVIFRSAERVYSATNSLRSWLWELIFLFIIIIIIII
jgi:hypothetical protein